MKLNTSGESHLFKIFSENETIIFSLMLVRVWISSSFPAAGQDYVSLDERMTLSSLQPFSVTVTILDDDILELTESFLVNLTVRYANLDGDPISTNSTVFVSIKDNDG